MRTTDNSTIHRWYALLAGAAMLAGTACSEPTSNSELQTAANAALSASLSSVPVGYGDLASSYVGTAAADAGSAGLWVGGGRDARMERGALMGGGLGDAFLGGIGFGPGPSRGHRGPFGGGLGCTGTFAAPTGRVTCHPATLRDGLTVTRSASYADVQGAVQQAFDSVTTNTVNSRSEVSGTVSYDRAADSAARGTGGGPGGGPGDGHRGHGWGEGRGPGGRLLGDTATILSATTTIQSTSDRTVSGLAQGSTQRTVNGTSAGQESTAGTSSRGQFTATRMVGDTTRGLVVPVQANGQPYPTAGTVVRAIQATLTYAGQAAATLSRREVVTYDGSTTAKVEITENGTTRSCTRPLPRGGLSCQ